jgi:hypothetical protein
VDEHEYSAQYREYLALRDMCRMMIALQQRDYNSAANIWKKHEGPHYHLTRHAITWLITHFAHSGQDPAGWARGYEEVADDTDASVRGMCRMMSALCREDYDAALDVWNEHDGPHVRIAMQAMTALATYLVYDGKDPVEQARGYEAFAAQQVGESPFLTIEAPGNDEGKTMHRNRPEALVALAIAVTSQNLGMNTTEGQWGFSAGDDTSDGYPYVEHYIIPGSLWLRVTGGFNGDLSEARVSPQIWCPQLLGGSSWVPMEPTILASVRSLLGR